MCFLCPCTTRSRLFGLLGFECQTLTHCGSSCSLCSCCNGIFLHPGVKRHWDDDGGARQHSPRGQPQPEETGRERLKMLLARLGEASENSLPKNLEVLASAMSKDVKDDLPYVLDALVEWYVLMPFFLCQGLVLVGNFHLLSAFLACFLSTLIDQHSHLHD